MNTFDKNQMLRASLTDSKLSDEQDMNLDGSIMQPKNRPSEDIDLKGMQSNLEP